MAASSLRMKLLVDKKTKKVLFAVVDKQVVDFLFNLLSLPVGTIVKLLKNDYMVGSLGNLYNSVENLSEAYMEPNQTKVSILEPSLPPCVAQVPLLLSNPTSPTTDKGTVSYYTCRLNNQYHSYSGNPYRIYVSNNGSTFCPQCKLQMSTKMTYIAGTVKAEEKPRGNGGYVKELVTYMVMDDLSVTPMSTISGITLLNKLNVKEVGSLEEKMVDLGMDEGLEILKASLQSKSVLTDVFLGKKLIKRSRRKLCQMILGETFCYLPFVVVFFLFLFLSFFWVGGVGIQPISIFELSCDS